MPEALGVLVVVLVALTVLCAAGLGRIACAQHKLIEEQWDVLRDQAKIVRAQAKLIAELEARDGATPAPRSPTCPPA